MSKTNYDLAHAFFYASFGDEYYPRYKNCGYRGNRFFSYSTVIAMIVKNKKGDEVTLLSSDSMTPTTAKQRSFIWSASPFKIYKVPFEYGGKPYDVNDIPHIFKNSLEKLESLKMTLKRNREAFCETYNNAKRFSDDILTLDFLDEFEELYNILNDSEKVKAIKAKEREKQAKEIKALKKELAEILKKPYLEIVKTAYDCEIWWNPPKLYAKLQKVLNPNCDLSFVWRNAYGDYCTSKRIFIKKEIGDLALNLWKHGKLKHGMKFDGYTVLSVTDKVVQIGCHKIPVENLKALAS